MIFKYQFLKILAAIFVGFVNLNINGLEVEPIRNIVTIEDHPWVIKNETCLKLSGNKSCLSPCYYGLLVDVLHIIHQDLKNLNNCKIHEVNSFGILNKSVTPPAWNGIIGDLLQNKSDLALAVLNLTRKDWKDSISFSYPLVNSTAKNITLGFGYQKASKIEKQINHMIYKLRNQRHIELLFEKWFNEQYDDVWTEKKQLTKGWGKKINKRKQ